jgi:uncharacterized protein (DUF305 family)
MPLRSSKYALFGVLCALALVGCSLDGGDDPESATGTAPAGTTATGPVIIQPGAPGEENRTLSEDELDDYKPPEATEADVEFMQNMILHHRQALYLAELVPSRSARKNLPLFAKRIDISQRGEIERMEDWLAARGEEPPPEGGDHAGHLPGMLTAAQLARVEAADGARFDELFLRAMRRHHFGALAMVYALRDTPGAAAEPELSVFANDVVADQTIEIRRIEGLLEKLEG